MGAVLRAGKYEDDRPPVWEIPAVLPREVIITRSDQAAISVGDVHVYSQGVLACFYVRANPRWGELNQSELRDFTDDFQKLLDPTGLVLDISAGEFGSEGLSTRAGQSSIYSDFRGAQGTDFLWRLQYWVFPLPKNGVVYSGQWASRGVKQGSFQLSSSEILKLGTSIQNLRLPIR